jgi:hypothetical protein
MKDRLSSRCREWIHASLAGEGEGGAEAFVAAVVEQIAHPLGSAAPPSEEVEGRAVAEVIRFLRDAGDPAADPAHPDAARRLRGQALLLSAFFANIDLLYQHRYPDADAVAALVMRAME